MFKIDTLIESNDDIIIQEDINTDKDIPIRLEKSYYEMQKENHKKYIELQKENLRGFAKVQYQHKMMVKVLMGKKISDLGREIWTNKAGQWVLEEIIKNNTNVEDQLAVIKRFWKKDKSNSLLGYKVKIQDCYIPRLEIPSMSYEMLKNSYDLSDELTWQNGITPRLGMFIRLFPDWMQGKPGALERELSRFQSPIPSVRYKRHGYSIPEMIDYVTAINREYKDKLDKYREDYHNLMKDIEMYESQFEQFTLTYNAEEIIQVYMHDREVLCNSLVFAYKELCKKAYESHAKIAEAVNEVYQKIVNNSAISKNDWED